MDEVIKLREELKREIDLATAEQRKAIDALTDAEFNLKHANRRLNEALEALDRIKDQYHG